MPINSSNQYQIIPCLQKTDELFNHHILYKMEMNSFLKKQLGLPFRISNRGLDSVDRFLTFNNVLHPTEQKKLVEFDVARSGPQKDTQIWTIQHYNGSRQVFTIKHQKSNLYLTLVKSKALNQYFAQLSNLRQGLGVADQLWSFGMRENRRFTIKAEPLKGKFYYLEYAQTGSLKEEFSTLFVCRPEQTTSHRYLRNWKLSPVKETFELPCTNLQNVRGCCQSEQFFALIKQFKGKIYTKDDSEYFIRIQQYASSSIKESQAKPFFLTYPQDAFDISVMIKIAQRLGKKVVARSGGHQYSGLSLGGQNTIVLSMDQFNTLKLRQDGIIQAGPCVPLIDFARKLREWEISIPHGLCPLVNLGGLGQTGGYGVLYRSYGLLIDYIQAFDIVLANGTQKRVTRPVQNGDRFNLQLFRGVLGGNAGSFGIVTKYFLRGNKNSDHPYSYGFSKVRLYNKDLLRQLFVAQKQWSQIIASGQDNQDLRGADFEFGTSFIQLQVLNVQSPAIFLLGVYGDPIGGIKYNNQMKSILDKFSQGQTELQKQINEFYGSWEATLPLTQIMYKNVYEFPQVGASGRENSIPYNRRCNLTMSALTNDYVDQFVKYFDKATINPPKGLYIDTLFLVAGGAYRDNGKTIVDGLTVTSIPQRNFVACFMLDILYDLEADPNADRQAQKMQDKMQKIVDQYFNTPGLGDKKFFWGSFGDLDMRKQSVIKTFYDSFNDYEKLQELKKKVDPKDVFHTIMTVKLPQ